MCVVNAVAAARQIWCSMRVYDHMWQWYVSWRLVGIVRSRVWTPHAAYDSINSALRFGISQHLSDEAT